MHGAARRRFEAAGNSCRTPDGVRERRLIDEGPAVAVGPYIAAGGATIVVELSVGEERGRYPCAVPVGAVVIDRNDGAGAAFKDQKLPGVLITDEVVAGLESELLVAPDQVDEPRPSRDVIGGGAVFPRRHVTEEVLVVELRAAIDSHGNGVGECHARVVGVELWLNCAVGGIVVADEGDGLEAVLLLLAGQVANIEIASGLRHGGQRRAQRIVERAAAIEGRAGPGIDGALGGGHILSDGEVLQSRTHGVVEEVLDHFGRIAVDIVEAEAVDAGLTDEPGEPGAGVATGCTVRVGVAGVAATALVAEVRAKAVGSAGSPVIFRVPVLRVEVEVEPVARPSASPGAGVSDGLKESVLLIVRLKR